MTCSARVSACWSARRLQLSLNTVKRYARADQPARLQRAPQYRATLADPYRGHLRRRRAEDPAVPVLQLLREIRELGRVEADRPHPAGQHGSCSPGPPPSTQASTRCSATSPPPAPR
jgi:hypothetical protein